MSTRGVESETKEANTVDAQRASVASPLPEATERGFAERYMPRLSARVQLVLAGGMWVAAALLLGVRGGLWIASEPKWIALSALAIVLGLLKARFLLDPVARRAAERIVARGRDRCAGGFFSWQSWLMVFAMIAIGHTLRLTTISRPLLGVLYILVACALVFASRIYWDAAFGNEPSDVRKTRLRDA